MITRQDILMERAKRIGDDLESQGAILNYKSTAILFLALDSAYEAGWHAAFARITEGDTANGWMHDAKAKLIQTSKETKCQESTK